MLLYLASNQNIGIFDFLANEKGIIIKKLSGEFNLKKFVVHDMRGLNHYRYFAIDLKALKDNPNEIIDAVKAFNAMYDSRVIIFAEGVQGDSSVLSELIEEKIYNIITSTEIDEIKEEILKCVSDDGMIYKDCMKLLGREYSDFKLNKPRYIFKERNIKIAVAGVQSKVGTTTTAFNLTNFLNSCGAKVSYTEANENNHLKDVVSCYEFDAVDKNCFKYNEIEYYMNKQYPNDYHFNIFDLGVLNGSIFPVFKGCDIRILCLTAKPYETLKVHKAIEMASGVYFNIIISFASDREKHKINKMIDGFEDKLYFSGYSPNLFDGEVNTNIYKAILKDYFVEI